MTNAIILKDVFKAEAPIGIFEEAQSSVHWSPLGGRLGQSFHRLSRHINNYFKSKDNVPLAANACLVAATPAFPGRSQRRSLSQRGVREESVSEDKDTPQATVEQKDFSSSWEEGYLHFARHINKYFGAKVSDEVQSRREELPVEKTSQRSTQSTSQTQGPTSRLKQEDPTTPEAGGLFHSSHVATNFGENFFQTASHINQYFNGQSEVDEETDGKSVDSGSEISERLAKPTRVTRPAMTSRGAILNKMILLSQRQVEELTCGLIGSLELASSPGALVACVEALNEHLILHPSCKALMWQDRTAVTLLRKRRSYRDDQDLQNALRETLALIGYVEPVKGSGIRVLSIDGGGTRGVVPLQVLKLLEEETGRKIHELFDYICGVSTGAILAFMLGLARFSLEECFDITETWESILREKLGDKVLIKTARDELSPKVSAVSAVVNWGTSPKAFVFRTYNHTCQHPLHPEDGGS
ncbi:unnamed protein product [Pleuronectes platessa]|uniref:PNPLA domain-containing protein n=1 Tax=Pleuronectes platessa TaxID=8262 RepID=A0A9N7YR30_PLEPL|nr:unnamed protein product [Pleuronectes platessa]